MWFRMRRIHTKWSSTPHGSSPLNGHAGIPRNHFSMIWSRTYIWSRLRCALRREMNGAARALPEVRRFIDMPRGRIPITCSADGRSTNLTFTRNAWQMGLVLRYDSILRLHADGALADIQGIINVNHCIGDEPALSSMFARVALQSMAVRGVERCVAQSQPSEASLAKLQRILEEESKVPLLLIWARGKRAEGGITLISKISPRRRRTTRVGRCSSCGLPPPFHRVGTPIGAISELNGWSASSSVNASPTALRPPAHNSGPRWVATPFLCGLLLHDGFDWRWECPNSPSCDQIIVPAIGQLLQCVLGGTMGW
jgi:hypothetical protein